MKVDPRERLPDKDGIYFAEYKLGFRNTARFEVGDAFDEGHWQENIKYWVDTEEVAYTKEDMVTAYTLGCVNGNCDKFNFSEWLNSVKKVTSEGV